MLETVGHCLGGDAFHLGTGAQDALGVMGGVHAARVRLARRQALLPTSMSGLGCACPQLTHPCAHVGSWVATLRWLGHVCESQVLTALVASAGPLESSACPPLVELRETWDALAALLDDSAPLLRALKIGRLNDIAATPVGQVQHILTDVAARHYFAALVDSAPTSEDRVRLLSASGRGAGEFLRQAPYCPTVELSNLNWRLVSLTRLGLNQTLPCYAGDDSPCAPGCFERVRMHVPDDASGVAPRGNGDDGLPIAHVDEDLYCDKHGLLQRRVVPDDYGHHSMVCKYNSVWVRHIRLCNVLQSIHASAGIVAKASSVEHTVGMRHVLGQQQADLVVEDFNGAGMDAHVDTTCIHPLAITYRDFVYKKPGDAVRLVRAVLKRVQYGVMSEFGRTFVPFGAESYGALDPEAISYLQDFVARTYVIARGETPEEPRGLALAAEFMTRALGRLSMAIQKSNAEVLIRGVKNRHRHDKAYGTYLGRVARAPLTTLGARTGRKKRRRAPRNPGGTA